MHDHTILRSISPVSRVPSVADVQPSRVGTTPVVTMVMTHKRHTHVGIGFQSLQQTYNNTLHSKGEGLCIISESVCAVVVVCLRLGFI